MRIDVTQVLMDLDGKALVNEDSKPGPDGKPVRTELTVRAVCRAVLTLPLRGDEPDGVEKYRRGGLAYKIISENTPDIESEDIAMLKKLCGLGYTTAVVFPFYNALERRATDGPTGHDDLTGPTGGTAGA